MTIESQFGAFRKSVCLLWTMGKSPARTETNFSVPGLTGCGKSRLFCHSERSEESLLVLSSTE